MTTSGADWIAVAQRHSPNAGLQLTRLDSVLAEWHEARWLAVHAWSSRPSRDWYDLYHRHWAVETAKYIRIGEGSGGVCFFIERTTGEVFRAASWDKPKRDQRAGNLATISGAALAQMQYVRWTKALKRDHSACPPAGAERT